MVLVSSPYCYSSQLPRVRQRTRHLESQMKATLVTASISCFCCCHAAPLHAKDTDNIYHGSTPTGGSYLRGRCSSHREICEEKKKREREVLQNHCFLHTTIKINV